MTKFVAVAASCCWREVLDKHLQYPEILHGGVIGTHYVVERDYSVMKAGFDKSWLNLGWDLNDAGIAAGWAATISLDYDPTTGLWYDPSNKGVPNYDGAGNSDAANGSYGIGWAEPKGIEFFAERAGYKGLPCDHKDGSCKYWEPKGTYYQNYHLNATSAHAGLDKWADPHKAVQYSS